MTSNHDDQEQQVFVYGTLRKQGSNAWRMKGATYLSEARTKGRLYRVDWYPAANFDDSGESFIIGELYRLSEAHLQELDAFEGSEYRRIKITVITSNQETQIAWAWQYQESFENLAPMLSGDWLKEL
jgi:gamma-glutamylcyclotransferase (GGCT)/AIG2-like uncharacterized protein YtfP